jgi:uncharacterized protein (DUF58 family)
VAEARRIGDGLLPIDWGEISPLRLRAKLIAEGVYSGAHRSTRRGSGIEFGGQRPYVPGDDLRFLDRRSLLRHDRLMVREFETETERSLWLCLDASASMAFRGQRAPGAKLAYAALLAAALCRVVVAGHDRVGLTWLGGQGLRDLPPMTGVPAFERVVAALEAARAVGDLSADLEELERSASVLGRRAARGSVVVVVSDFIDLPSGAESVLAALGGRKRMVLLLQVLDEDERDLGLSGKVRLRAMEGEALVITDVDAVRAEYQARLEEHTSAWRRAAEAAGGRLVSCVTTDPAARVVRRVLQAIAEGAS